MALENGTQIEAHEPTQCAKCDNASTNCVLDKPKERYKCKCKPGYITVGPSLIRCLFP